MSLDRDKLLSQLLKTPPAQPQQQPQTRVPEGAELPAEVEAIVKDESLKKSEKIRRLLRLGLSRGQIARLLKIRYQQVYAVYEAMRRR